MPGFFVALTYPQNGDLTKSLKSAREKVPQSARLSAGGDAKAIWAMPKCLLRFLMWGFPYRSLLFLALVDVNLENKMGTMPMEKM